MAQAASEQVLDAALKGSAVGVNVALRHLDERIAEVRAACADYQVRARLANPVARFRLAGIMIKRHNQLEGLEEARAIVAQVLAATQPATN